MRRLLIPLLLAVCSLLGMLAAAPAAAARAVPPPVNHAKPVPVHVVHGKKAALPKMKLWQAPKTTWPAAGSATVTPGSSATRAGSAPIWVNTIGNTTKKAAAPKPSSSPTPSSSAKVSPSASPSSSSSPRSASSSPGTVKVGVAPRQTAQALGIPGLVFTVGNAAGSAAGRKLRVRVDYSSFRDAYGGGYASRLRLVALPACAVTTPDVPACRKTTPLATRNNAAASTLSADVPVPAGTRAATVAAAPSPSGDGGNYSATKLSEAGSWAEGGNSGAFTYSYPVSVPPVPGGLEPKVALDYNSQTADGMTSSTDNQASEIGDGWNYDPGSVQTSYPSCEQQPPNATGWTESGDLCDSSDAVTTLTLNGKTTKIVRDGSGGGYHAQDDGNERIQVKYGETNGNGNGSRSGQYWVITEPDGTQYYFGQNHVDDWASGDAVTNSADVVPVNDYVPGGACQGTHCWYPYRWNLDYVVGPHGDAEALYYGTEMNYYAFGSATTANVTYTQASTLSKIVYGFRAGSLYSGTTPAGEVDFTTAENRTDVPADLSCASGAACQVGSPTFWSKYKLTGISTKVFEGGSADVPVDSWALSQSYPDPQDATTKQPSLWLDSVRQTGQDGGSVQLPPVTFTGTPMANRVVPPSDIDPNTGLAKYSEISRLRMTGIENETGGQTAVAYTSADTACSQGNYPAADSNATMCYPDWWTPQGGSLTESWFNKYAVSQVKETDTTGGNPDQVTNYAYSGPAWHYTEDATVSSAPTDQRTWDVWRGFRTVTTKTGASPDPVTKKVDTYLQGMDGDPQSGGGTSSATVSDGQGDTVTDSSQYQGNLLEDVVDNGDSGSVVTDTVTLPWSAASGATQSQPSPMPSLQSFYTGTKEKKAYTALAGGGNRESDTTNTFDSYGRVTQSSAVPDTSDSSQDTCTATTYADNTGAWIMSLAKEVQVVSVPCGTTPSYPGDAVSDKLAFYDGATSLDGDTPTTGDVTETRLATSYDSSGSPQYTTQNTSTYDGHGRVLTSADADNRTTTTDYQPTGREPAQETVTDPQGLQTVTHYDPARELPTSTTNPAGLTTTGTYDALGRLTAVWTPGNATSGPASMKFAYTVSDTGPSYSVTSTLDPDASGYLDSVTVYDSLGQTAEDQEQQPGGGWDITATAYDSNGKQDFAAGPYYAGSITEGAMVQASRGDVADETSTVYDGAGRTVKSVAESKNTQTWETDTAYDGNYTTTSYKCSSSVAKCGGTPETVFTDGRGLKTAIYQYHAGASPDPSDPSSDYDKTAYAYFPSQKLKQITDAVGNQWNYTYDLSGNELTDTDPDAGKTTDTYDAANQLVTSTDARDKQVSYVYDNDGRKTAEYDTTGGVSETSSDEIASWTYDTLAKGQLTSSSSYYNGQAYTEKTMGYNAFGEPTGTEVIIPSDQGALAGTYITMDKAYAKTGELESYQDSAAGGLPAETVNYTYDAAGDPTAMDGIQSYVNSLSYDELGNPQQYRLGSSSEPAYVTDSYDPQTNALAGQQTSTGTTPATVDDLKYSYDNIGNVLSENDQPAGGAAQSQCFSYDYLGRLATAWSQASACTPSSSPSTSAESGAAAPYWNTYTYNTVGNLTRQTSEQPDGTVTTTDATFPSSGSAQPHAPASETQSGGAAGTTSYTYDAAGHMTSSSENTVAGILQSQSLAWDDAGRLSSVTSPSGGLTPTAKYFYDAGGNLLIEADPGQNTLFLPDEQIVDNTTTGTLSGTRYYTIGSSGTSTSSGTTGNASASADSSSSGSDGGGTTASNASSSSTGGGSSGGSLSSGAASTGVGSKSSSEGAGATVACRTSSGEVDYLVGDKQSTAGLAIRSSDLHLTQRYYDPYGNPVGTAPASWPGGSKGFVGGTESRATGLTNLGAREYQPQTEAFISPDSLINPDDPQNLNAYAYASNNPSTDSDPTGATCITDGNGVCHSGATASVEAKARANQSSSGGSGSNSSSSMQQLLNSLTSGSSNTAPPSPALAAAGIASLLNQLQQIESQFSKPQDLPDNHCSPLFGCVHSAALRNDNSIVVRLSTAGMRAWSSSAATRLKMMRVIGELLRLYGAIKTGMDPHSAGNISATEDGGPLSGRAAGKLQTPTNDKVQEWRVARASSGDDGDSVEMPNGEGFGVSGTKSIWWGKPDGLTGPDDYADYGDSPEFPINLWDWWY